MIGSHINGSVLLWFECSLILFCILILREHVTYFVFILSIIVERILHLVVGAIVLLLNCWLYWIKTFEVLLLTMLKAEDCSTRRINAPCVSLTAYRDLFFYPFNFIKLLFLLLPISGHCGVDCPHFKQIIVVTTKLFPFFIFLIYILVWYIHLVWIIVMVTVHVPLRVWNGIKLLHAFILVFHLLLQTWLHWDYACLLVKTSHWGCRCPLLLIVLLIVDALVSF